MEWVSSLFFFFATDHCGSTNYLLLYWVQRYGSNPNSQIVWLSNAHFLVTSSVSGGKGCRDGMSREEGMGEQSGWRAPLQKGDQVMFQG